MGMHNKGTYTRVLTYAYTRIDIHVYAYRHTRIYIRVYAKYERIIRVCVVRIYLSCTVRKNGVFLFGISFFVIENNIYDIYVFVLCK